MAASVITNCSAGLGFIHTEKQLYSQSGSNISYTAQQNCWAICDMNYGSSGVQTNITVTVDEAQVAACFSATPSDRIRVQVPVPLKKGQTITLKAAIGNVSSLSLVVYEMK